MAPILHIMRHGQGYHSEAVNKNGHEIRDPWLTPKGVEQCHERCKSFARHDQVELLLASPLRRALQTCALSFAPVLDKSIKIIALPMAEEASDAPCDTGSPLEVLRKDFPQHVDFDHIKYGWFHHDGEYAIDPKALNARAAKLRRWIRDRSEKEVVLVSHGFFNHYMTGDVNEKGEQTTPWWQETELRTFTFLEDREDAMIEETDKSLLGRGAVKDGLIINRPELRGKDR
ncbi:hypothetical protein BAUCODRAFT_508777 [Baudoinia panamericana UAMH 10762]|uniref:Phosphoglycerate mutase-like protein n=1 Tax=Baudoinia panamericana (strain UAMH 10762) TaxID=717646 RepID=M2MWI0_BAUPA|nr:uncharacterized protein BAUCODRAFT_508777 [Baudoinia panamericana UAMH 10762]EMC95903.1 hypothetical protein BAUCODRAFT_508777 [Baudoinia panamericana UAMH 10762]